jgi:hypothetical protein
LFERVIETEQLFINLERAVRFDKLGVNQALLRLKPGGPQADCRREAVSAVA